MMPTVAIVIPTYNGDTTLSELLGSLAGQIDAPPFEVVLADNGSRDGTGKIASTFDDRLKIRWVDAGGGNRGPAYARRIGVLNTTADHLLFLDQDDVPNLSYVHAMSRTLESSQYVY